MSAVLARVNDVMRVWWPLFMSAASVALVTTLAWVTWTVIDERSYFEAEQARDRRQDAALERVLLQQRDADDLQAERLQDAIADVERLLADQFALHDANTATKLNDLLAQVAALLGRPAPKAPAQHAEPPPPNPPPAAASSPEPAPPPPTTTTTTQPGRPDLCDRAPTAFPCRSNR